MLLAGIVMFMADTICLWEAGHNWDMFVTSSLSCTSTTHLRQKCTKVVQVDKLKCPLLRMKLLKLTTRVWCLCMCGCNSWWWAQTRCKAATPVCGPARWRGAAVRLGCPSRSGSGLCAPGEQSVQTAARRKTPWNPEKVKTSTHTHTSFTGVCVCVCVNHAVPLQSKK